MGDGFNTVEECEEKAKEAIKTNGGTKANIYENGDTHVKIVHD